MTLEFKPMADIASGSKNALRMLKMLDSWIAQKDVTCQLWSYMDSLLANWRGLNRADFLRSALPESFGQLAGLFTLDVGDDGGQA